MYQESWKRFYVAKPRPDEGSGWLRGRVLLSASRLALRFVDHEPLERPHFHREQR